MSPWHNPETWFTGAIAIGTIAEALVLRRLTRLEKATYGLQRAFEEDRKRVDLFVQLITDPSKTGSNMGVVFRLSNLSSSPIYFGHVQIAVTVEGQRRDDYKIEMGEIVREGGMRDFRIDHDIGRAAAKHGHRRNHPYGQIAEVKVSYWAHGSWRETPWTKEMVAVMVPA